MARLTEQSLEELADHLDTQIMGEEEEHYDDSPWQPSLNSGKQQELYFNDEALYLLVDGPRGCGKSWGVCEKMVRHCVKEPRGFVTIICGNISQILDDGGMMQKLVQDILPEWHERTGINYTPIKHDTSGRPYITIENIHGGISMIKGVSIPFAVLVESRMRGLEPTMAVVEEATTFANDKAYLKAILSQLGRSKKTISCPQQLILVTNPDSPDHWIYQTFYVSTGLVEHGEVQDKRYAVYTFSYKENEQNMNEGYLENNVMMALEGDDVGIDRLVHGLWRDDIDGDGVYRNYWHEGAIRGGSGKLLKPNRMFPIKIGYDLGQRCNGLSLMQEIMVRGVPHWIIFDEIYQDRKIGYDILTEILMDRMEVWCDIVQHPFVFEHISDSSALNQFRPGGAMGGSYDAWDIEENSTRLLKEGRYKWLKEPIVMQAAPKFNDSVRGRVKLVRTLLRARRLHISRLCRTHIAMFNRLPADKDNPHVPKKPHPLGHINDSMSYPMIESEIYSGPTGSVEISEIRT